MCGGGRPQIRVPRRVPKLAIQPDTAAIDKTLPVLVLGDIPADVYAYADRIGVPVVRVLTAHRALEHLSVSPFRAVAVSPEIEGGIELVKQVKLATDFGDSEGEDAVSRNMLTPFIVLPFQGEEEYAVLVVPPDAAYLERTSNLRLSAALFRLDVDRIVRDLFRGSC